MNCRPPVFNKIIDPMLSSMWITDIKGTFDTNKCEDEDKGRLYICGHGERSWGGGWGWGGMMQPIRCHGMSLRESLKKSFSLERRLSSWRKNP
uniref:Uncharacterized protein n=1 Tax=Lactuca sativa TaxID=4236 RepID=A0A9R1W0I2_LACSA|nr:hypothetical protein LSAT_V11C300144520 [Lactuca sativa]